MPEEKTKDASTTEKDNKNKRGMYKLDPTDTVIGDFHISINKDMASVDAASLLKKMYAIRNNTSLTTEEKAARVQQIVNNLQA